ncbi:MAG: hypothetical protein WBE72_05725 [Terracidiphilus sp.]
MSLKSVLELLSSVPYDADLTPETLEFASGTAKGGMPGSLYFKRGRIRLVHPDRPKIAKHGIIHRYSLSARGVRNFKKYKRHHWKAERIYEGLKKHGNLHYIRLGSKETLIEFFENRQGKIVGFHRSRGGPIKAPGLVQAQIDLMARAADSRSNKVMNAVYPYALSHFK